MPTNKTKLLLGVVIFLGTSVWAVQEIIVNSRELSLQANFYKTIDQWIESRLDPSESYIFGNVSILIDSDKIYPAEIYTNEEHLPTIHEGLAKYRLQKKPEVYVLWRTDLPPAFLAESDTHLNLLLDSRTTASTPEKFAPLEDFPDLTHLRPVKLFRMTEPYRMYVTVFILDKSND